MFDWSDLRHFLAVHRHGSLAKAARELHVDQTTVGRRIAQLEQGLGAKLFDRAPEGLRLTPSGRDVLCIAERLETEALALERLVQGRDVNPEGTVRITTGEAFGARFLGPRLGTIRAKYAGIRLEVITNARMFSLSRREADIAIRFDGDQAGLVRRRVCKVTWALYGARSYLATKGTPGSVAALRAHDLLAYDDSLDTTPEAQWMARVADGRPYALRSNSTGLLLNATRDGFGLAMLPCWLADADDSIVRVLPKDAHVARDLTLVVHEDLRRVARVRVVFDALLVLFAKEKAVLAGAKA